MLVLGNSNWKKCLAMLSNAGLWWATLGNAEWCWLKQCNDRFYRIVGTIGLKVSKQCWAIFGNSGQCWAMPSNAEQCWAMLSHNGQCWVMLTPSNDRFIGPIGLKVCNAWQCWAMLSNAEQCWVMLSNAEQYWAMLGNAESCWAMLSNADTIK